MISVCVPAYNAKSFIADTLKSILNQTYHNWELIVIEDGSDDGTEEIVTHFANSTDQDVFFFRNEKNLGLTATRNRLLKHARGEWVALLDSDDLWKEKHLENFNKIVDNQSIDEFDVFFSGFTMFEDKTNKILKNVKPDAEYLKEISKSIYTRKIQIQPSSTIIRRSTLIKIGGSNEEFSMAEDLELWLRLLKNGFKFKYSGDSTCLYRKSHGAAMTNNTKALTLGTAQAYSYNFEIPSISAALRKKITSQNWFYVAKMYKDSDLFIALAAIKKALSYHFSIKYLSYLILIKTMVIQKSVRAKKH